MDWSCTGEQSALAVPHRPLMVVVGLQVPTSGGTTGCPHLQWGEVQSVLLQAPTGLQEIAPHLHDVPA